MTPDGRVEQQRSSLLRSGALALIRSRTFWCLVGIVIGVALSVWTIDPTLFRLRATVTKPVRPAEPPFGTSAGESLAKTYDFDNEKLVWDVILPLAEISEAAYREGAELDSTLGKLGLNKVSEFPVNSMF